MLTNFFKLNGEPHELGAQDEFLQQLQISDHLKNIVYLPDRLAPDRPANRIQGKTFENVSFSKTLISSVEFRRCRFIDCLFVGTTIEDCEFHDCTFAGVNPHKIRLEGTYIDPEVFAKVLKPEEHANIGVHLFQQLFANASSTHQTRFAHSAEYHFERWRRFYLNYERKKKKIGPVKWFFRWLPNIAYNYVAGYGLRSRFFAGWTLATLIGVVALNYWQWETLAVRGAAGPVESAGVAQAFYFSVVTMATVGFGDLVPTSKPGMLLVASEALLGVVWLSLFASTLIKRIAR